MPAVKAACFTTSFITPEPMATGVSPGRNWARRLSARSVVGFGRGRAGMTWLRVAIPAAASAACTCGPAAAQPRSSANSTAGPVKWRA
jgi:hypothetical protein